MTHIGTDIELETSSGNVYEDIGVINSDEMLVKAQLASKIGEIIKNNKWTQQQSARILGLTQSRMSMLLRGNFSGISEAKMMECLVKLGREVHIVVSNKEATTGHVGVVFEENHDADSNCYA